MPNESFAILYDAATKTLTISQGEFSVQIETVSNMVQALELAGDYVLNQLNPVSKAE